MGKAGLLLAHFETRTGTLVMRQWPAQDILPMRGLFGIGAFHMLAHPVANFAIAVRIFNDLDKLFVRHAGSLEPETVKAFAKIFSVIRVKFAGEMQADFVNIARQVTPTVHDFARTAWIDNFAHTKKMKRQSIYRNVKI